MIYAKAGTLPAAAILASSDAIVDHKLYWCAVDDRNEALYLCSIINSETAREAVEHLQSGGQWGARDFDKVMFTLPISRFTSESVLHQELASAAAHAEYVASSVELPERMGFVRHRQIIRAALREDGVAKTIDDLVAQLLFKKTG